MLTTGNAQTQRNWNRYLTYESHVGILVWLCWLLISLGSSDYFGCLEEQTFNASLEVSTPSFSYQSLFRIVNVTNIEAYYVPDVSSLIFLFCSPSKQRKKCQSNQMSCCAWRKLFVSWQWSKQNFFLSWKLYWHFPSPENHADIFYLLKNHTDIFFCIVSIFQETMIFI